MNQIQVIVFDFDGVLVQSNEVKDEAFRQIFSRYPEHLDALMSYHMSTNTVPRGEKIRHAIQNIIQLSGDSEAVIRSLIKDFETITRKKVVECAEVPGAHKSLQSLKPFFPLYVASATPQMDLDLVIKGRGWAHYFHKTYGAPIKKHQVLIEIAQHHHIQPHNILFLGDSPEDLESAKKAGVEFLGIVGRTDFKNQGVRVESDLHGLLHLAQNWPQ